MASGRTLLTWLLAFGVVFLGCGAPGTESAHGGGRQAVVERRPIPTASLKTLDRSATELATVLGGRPALVSLWATWCEACRKEMPELGQIDAWAKQHDAVVVGVAVGESVETITRFTGKTALPYLVVVDEEFRFADAVGSKRVPATLVVDRLGTIVWVGGAVDEDALAAFRRAVGATPPVARTPTSPALPPAP